MDNNENFVAEQVTENVEQTTEETPKMFTQDEVNEIVGKSKARERAKVTRQFERKYGRLEEVLKTGTGKEDVDEIADTFQQFYQKKGIKFAEKPAYSEQDLQVLARVDADEIIRAGYDEVVEEVERLTELGADRMNPREKALFKVLAEHRQGAERGAELSKIGVTEDVYNSKEFSEFASKFSHTTPIRDIYDIYAKTQPKKNIRTMGSMKNSNSDDSGVKEFYTPEEARRFTKKDFDNNPALFKAVENSMLKWKRK